jgi:hypothetical protein
VTEIVFEIFEGNYPCSMKLLSTLIDFSKIVQLTWNAYYAYYCYGSGQHILLYLKTFLQQTHNLSSLFIPRYLVPPSEIINNLCSTIPRHVRHLQMPVENVHQIKTIIVRCENLSTVEFNIAYPMTEEVIKWFNDNTINSTCLDNYGTVYVWIGKKNIQSSEVRHDIKRFKSSDMYSNS